MFKYLLKPIIFIIILQMVLMPVAPVLAQELNQSTSTVVESVEPTVLIPSNSAVLPIISTEPTTVDDLTPIVPFITTSAVIAPERIFESQNISTSSEVDNIAPVNEMISVVSSTPVIEKLPEYSQLMRRLNRLDQIKEVKSDEFERFVQSEKDRLDKLDLDSSNKSAYFDQLDKQLKKLRNEPPTFIEKVVGKAKEIFGLDSRSKNSDQETFRIPTKPAEFKFNTDEFTIQTLQSAAAEQPTPKLLDMFNEAFKIDQVSADSQYLPTINDVKADNEAIINSEIQDLVQSLNNNPVKILNYVRQNISYEPYFGAKKGSLGCLREKVCNDFDASSLTISLLRAAGIPARYKKSVVEMNVEQIKNLLGVDELKTAYLAWAMNKVPVYTLSAGTFNGKAEDYDFSNETALGLEWVFVEAYYDYDERGANIDNILSFSNVTTTADVQNILQGFGKKQWIPIDAVVKTYSRTKNEIVHDTANFNTQNFWNGFLQYNGNLSPLQKYAQDLKNTTGKDIYNASFQSQNVGTTDEFQILPPTLPYYTHTGEVGGSLIQPVAWSYIPDNYRAQVKISLLKDSDKSVVFEHEFFGNEINNAQISLSYEGVTDIDKQVIDSYGGIHFTPAALVNIKPYMLVGYAQYENNNSIKIGEQLVLHFDYIQNGTKIYSDEKFSIAGNSEGISVSLSRVQVDPNLDTNSKILLQGNSALASKYLQHLEETGDTLQKALDYRRNTIFTRAVVTQNRILSSVDGTPTTFDFKGLTIDASSYINDWSDRGIFNNHRKDFRLLWGLDASYYEGQIFDDITGLKGISTVKGLQYAYAHPGDYVVHNITKTNENIIDTLSFTANTKQNMHTDVQAGNTVITPDKAIADGAWAGILYVSLSSDGTGTYAIGEQSQMNGGWTNDALVAGWFNDYVENIYWTKLYVDKNGEKKIYSYQDLPKSVDSVSCNLLESAFNSAISDPNWKNEYGVPCAKEERQFGLVSHTYLLASNAAKFFSPNKYNYWVKRTDALNLIKSKVNIDKSEKFIFNPIAGTYAYRGSVAVYYQPIQPINGGESGKAWKVEGKVLSKLMDPHYDKSQSYICQSGNEYCGKYSWVLNKIGYPLGSENFAAKSLSGTNGYYQDFIGGQIYVETDWLDDAYYVPAEIAQTFNSSNYSANGQLGTGGQFGFPLNDPIKNGNTLYQDFENGYRIAATGDVNDNGFKISVQKDYSEGEYKDLMIDGFLDAFTEGGITGLVVNFAAGAVLNEAIQQITKQAVAKLAKKGAVRVGLRFVPGAGWVIGGLTAAVAVDQNLPLYKACTQDPYLNPPNPILEGAKPAYYCGKLGASSVLVGLGFFTNYAAGKLNSLYVNTAKARLGKQSLFSKVESSHDGEKLTSLFRENYKSRERVMELFQNTSDEEIKILIKDTSYVKRLLENDAFYKFNTIVKDFKRYSHIFQGNETGGWHYYPTGRSGSKISNKIIGKNGVYKAYAEFTVDGQLKQKFSSFFPDDWNEDKVLNTVYNAYNNITKDKAKYFVPGSINSYRYTINNIEVELFIDQTNNKIISAFPAETIINGF